MCDYMEYLVKYKTCKLEAKHTSTKTNYFYCDKVKVNGKPVYDPITLLLLQFGSTSISGPCPKCGKHS